MSDYQLHVMLEEGEESDTIQFFARDKGAALTCEVIGCSRAGRYTVEILGYPVLSRRQIRAVGSPELVCTECAREMRDAWTGALRDAVKSEPVAKAA